jgi:galactokinase
VNLVQRTALESFCADILEGYKKGTGIEAASYVVEAEDGVHEIREGGSLV